MMKTDRIQGIIFNSQPTSAGKRNRGTFASIAGRIKHIIQTNRAVHIAVNRHEFSIEGRSGPLVGVEASNLSAAQLNARLRPKR